MVDDAKTLPSLWARSERVSVARQAITLNSSTFKEAGDTETSDSGIMQQVSADITSAAVTMA